MLANDRRTKDVAAQDSLVELLTERTEHLLLPRLAAYGVRAEDIGRIVAHSRGSSMKTNPVMLTDAEVGEVVRARL